METQYFYLDNLHSILFLWGMSRPWEELSLEPFTALSVKKIEELGGKISIQRRGFFSPKAPLGRFSHVGCAEHWGCCRETHTFGPRVAIPWQLPLAMEWGARKQLSGQKQWQFLDLCSPLPLTCSIPKQPHVLKKNGNPEFPLLQGKITQQHYFGLSMFVTMFLGRQECCGISLATLKATDVLFPLWNKLSNKNPAWDSTDVCICRRHC